MSAAFRAAVESKDLEAMRDALHPDVVFNSPAVHAPYEGREKAMALLTEVIEVFEDFSYVDELTGEDTHGLVFRARVADKQLQGWDYLRLDDEGLVTEFTVMIRPLSGLMAVAQAMMERLRTA